MKLRHFILLALIIAQLAYLDHGTVSAGKDKKKKKDKGKKKNKIKIKYAFDDDDDHYRYYDDDHGGYHGGGSRHRRVGCEPHKFTFQTYEDSWCNYPTGDGYKVLSEI